MIRLRHKLLIHLLRMFDQVAVVACLGLAGNAHVATYRPREVLAILLVLMGSMFVFNHFVRYDANRFTELQVQLQALLKAVTATVILLVAVSRLLLFPELSAGEVLLVWVTTTALLAASRLLVRGTLRYSRRSGMTSRQLLIVGVNPQARRLAETFDRCPELGYRIGGFVAQEGVDASPSLLAGAAKWTVYGSVSNLKEILQTTSTDEVLICLPIDQCFPDIAKAIRLGEELGIVVRVIGDVEYERLLRRMHVEVFDGSCVLTFFRERMLFQLMFKRLLDLSAAAALLAILSPLLAIVALIIKITSPGPVLFVQERMGMNRRRFNLYKFRSMTCDADSRVHELAHLNEMDGPVFKIRNDPRVTSFGRLLRKTSIDELPQLFNVLMGSMSLVGPRPPLPAEVSKYDWLYQRRLSIKPGITCLWQVSGRNDVSFREWMELDKQYASNWSLWLDVKILLRTIPVVLTGRGAS